MTGGPTIPPGGSGGEGGPEGAPARFPVFVLAVPAVVALLFVAAPEALVASAGGVGPALGIAGAAALFAAACFGVMAWHTPDRPGTIASWVGVGAALLLYARAVLSLL